MTEQHTIFTVRPTAYLRNLDRDDLRAEYIAIHYQKPPVSNDDGSTTIGLCFPTLIVSGYVAEPTAIAERVAAILNKHWDDAP